MKNALQSAEKEVIIMFRIDKVMKGSLISREGEKTILETQEKGKKQIPCPCYWCCGAAFLAKCFGVTVQRVYQLRDEAVINPEREKIDGEQVFNLRDAIHDYIKFKIGEDNIFTE